MKTRDASLSRDYRRGHDHWRTGARFAAGWRLAIDRVLPIIIGAALAGTTVPLPVSAADESCGECEDPLIEIKDVVFGGDLPNFEEFVGWDEAKKGVEDFCTEYSRGMMVFTGFTKEHPCADMYYILDALQDKPRRFGAHTGTAKYAIKTLAHFDTSGSGELGLVRYTVGRKIKLDPPRIVNGRIEEYDYVIEKEGVDLVPLLGQVQIDHELIALKNGQVYDEATDVLDWVRDPAGMEIDSSVPEGEADLSYFFGFDETLVRNGVMYSANEGLIIGRFAPGSLASLEIHFEHGDVGRTIRKKETPSSCALEVDDTTAAPEMFLLEVSDIKNRFARHGGFETMPDNVMIALRARKGTVEGGINLQGWRVFTTSGGRIPQQILYRPPPCEEGSDDVLEFAGVCDFHHGPPSVGSVQFRRTIKNVLCHEVSAKVTRKVKEVFHNETHEPWKISEVSYSKETEATLNFIFDGTAQRIHAVHESGFQLLPVRKVNYRPSDVSVTRSSHRRDGIAHNERRNPLGLELATHTVHKETGSVIEIEALDANDVLNLYLDPSTGRVSEVHLPFLEVRFEIHGTYDWKRIEKRDDQLVTTEGVRLDDHEFDFEVQPTVDDLDACDRVTGGDGIHSLSGGCTETTPGEHKTVTETYRWEVSIR